MPSISRRLASILLAAQTTSASEFGGLSLALPPPIDPPMPPARPPLPPSPPAPPHAPINPCQVVVIGSSVAKGCCPLSDGVGWAILMGEALAAPPYLLSSHNAAIGGYNTNHSMDQLNEALAAHAPRVVVIGLSLANEGLVGSTTMAEALAVMDSFVSGLQALIARAEAAGASVMLGGVRRAPTVA